MPQVPGDDVAEQSSTRPELTWEDLRDRAKSIEQFGELDRVNCQWAIDRVSQTLPGSVLRLAHPMGHLLRNRAPWTLHWLRVLADAIVRVEPALGWPSLRSRLSKAETAAEAVSVLRVAANLVQAGLAVSIDIPVMINDRQRVPDLRIENAESGDAFHAEVSQLGPAMDQSNERDQFHRFSMALLAKPPGVLFAGRILRTLSAAHAADLERRIVEIVDRATASERIEELNLPDVIHLGVAPLSLATAFTLWREKNGFPDIGLSAPTATVDHFKRLKIKVRKEAEQLPNDLPNLMVIWSSDIVNGGMDLASTVRQLEEIVYDVPNISALVVGANAQPLAPPSQQAIGFNRWVRVVHSDFVGEEYFLIQNRFCTAKIAPSTLTRVFTAFA